MKLRSSFVVYAGLLSLLFMSDGAFAHDQIHISGSSTVFPYSKVVAETFGEIYPDYKTPIVESTGTGSGIKQFCQSDDDNSLDIANASRPMSSDEYNECLKNGVNDIEQIMFGHDGIVFVTDIKGPAWNFTPSVIYQALAEKVAVNGKLVNNPYKTWKEINSQYPAWPITMYLPSEKHGTREVFEEKLLAVGCQESGAAALYAQQGLNKKQIQQACIAVRKDGAAVDIDGDYSETLARLNVNKTGVGVFGLFFYENNMDKLRVATVNTVVPTAQTIASQKYPVSRPLYFYVKKSHLALVPGLKEYINFFLSDQMVGPDGTLPEYGLVSSFEQSREEQRKKFLNGVVLNKKNF